VTCADVGTTTLTGTASCAHVIDAGNKAMNAAAAARRDGGRIPWDPRPAQWQAGQTKGPSSAWEVRMSAAMVAAQNEHPAMLVTGFVQRFSTLTES
jgi:hypothetical protein